MRILASIIVLLSLTISMQAVADEDVGNIAIVEDWDNSILVFPTSNMPNVFLAKVACLFYQTHQDQYDALFVFNTAISNTQQGWTVRSFTEGIGKQIFDGTTTFCANNGRLRITVNMGNISTLPFSPDERANIILGYPLTGIELQCHEFGHHWLASVNYDKGSGRECMLRGYEPILDPLPGDPMCSGVYLKDFNQHWSNNFNSCSLMYGSCIEDLGGGNFRYTYDNVKYSQLDQYLMGLRTKDEVDPMFLVDTGELSGTGALPMQHGSSQNHTGVRVDLTIDDIIREEGERNPPSDMCHWKAAFILVHPAGQPPTPNQIQAVDNYRLRIESYYPYATDTRGSFDTRLDGCGSGTDACPGDPSPQCGALPDGDADAPADGDVDCTFNTFRCSDTGAVEICNPQGEWQHLMDCDPGMQCLDGECILKEDGDISDQDGDESSDGDTVDDVVDGDESASYCTYSETRCIEGTFEECSRRGEWRLAEDCEAKGMICRSGEGCVDQGGLPIDGDGNDSSSVGQENGSEVGCTTTEAPSMLLLACLMMLWARRRTSVYGRVPFIG